MKTIRRLIYGEVLIATGFVLVAFLSLFFFFDFVEELGSIGKPSRLDPEIIYGLRHALLYVGLLMPSRVYELLPISVLIGSVAVLARLAQSSEYTILRTSGLGPWKALRTLLGLGLIFVALTFAVGDYVAPIADKTGRVEVIYKAAGRWASSGAFAANSASGRPARGSRSGRPTATFQSTWARSRPPEKSARSGSSSLTTRACWYPRCRPITAGSSPTIPGPCSM